VANDLISLEIQRGGKTPEAAPTEPVNFTDQLQILIRGIALHSIESQPQDFAALQEHMGEIARSLCSESAPADLMAAIGKCLRILEDYNRKAAGLFKSQVEELKGMVAAMTDTLQFIASSSEASVKQLGFVESQLQRASGLDDLRQLRTYTSACLNLVKRESTRLQVETAEKIKSLKQDVARLSVRLKTAAVDESEDPVTGLPARAAAEQAIENRVSTKKSCVVALFLMDQLASINGKFGREVGDDMVMSSAHTLAKKLSGATLYRWSGPGFVAMFDPLVPSAEAERRARQAAAQKLERNIEAGERMLMVVVGFTCHLHHISAQTEPGDLFRRLDGLMVSAQG